MAEYHADGQFEPAEPVRASLSRFVTMVGAIVSLALLIGIGYWGYRMIVRDVSGVPVIQAMKGEARRVPADAGGETADFLGLSVNHVAADGTAAAPSSKVTLAPQDSDMRSDALTPEQIAARKAQEEAAAKAKAEQQARDQAAADAAAAAQAMTANGDAAPGAGGTAEGTNEDSATGTAGDGDETGAVAAAIASAAQEAGEETDEQAGTPEVKGGIASSVRPKAPPAGLAAIRAAVMDDPADAAPAPAPAAPVDPNNIPSGTQLAQLGAFNSEDTARKEWDRLSQHFAIYMKGKSSVIQKAETGGRTFYRLRVMGFNDGDDTRNFCAALIAEHADCIPVVSK